MPRDPAALANVLNGGAATPVFAGVAARRRAAPSPRCPSPAARRITIAAGARLRIGGQVLRVHGRRRGGRQGDRRRARARHDRGRRERVRRRVRLRRRTRRSTQVPVNLATGSNLVAVNADGASGTGPARARRPSSARRAACRWYAPGPGGALSLDGVDRDRAARRTAPTAAGRRSRRRLHARELGQAGRDRRPGPGRRLRAPRRAQLHARAAPAAGRAALRRRARRRDRPDLLGAAVLGRGSRSRRGSSRRRPTARATSSRTAIRRRPRRRGVPADQPAAPTRSAAGTAPTHLAATPVPPGDIGTLGPPRGRLGRLGRGVCIATACSPPRRRRPSARSASAPAGRSARRAPGTIASSRAASTRCGSGTTRAVGRPDRGAAAASA